MRDQESPWIIVCAECAVSFRNTYYSHLDFFNAHSAKTIIVAFLFCCYFYTRASINKRNRLKICWRPRFFAYLQWRSFAMSKVVSVGEGRLVLFDARLAIEAGFGYAIGLRRLTMKFKFNFLNR